MGKNWGHIVMLKGLVFKINQSVTLKKTGQEGKVINFDKGYYVVSFCDKTTPCCFLECELEDTIQYNSPLGDSLK